MVLTERETLNLALEALREKLVLPKETVILKEYDTYKNYDAVVQIMDVEFLCEVKNMVTTATVGNITNRLKILGTMEKQTGIVDCEIYYANRYGQSGKQRHQHS